MKDPSKERLATFLMEELLERLGSRSDIRSTLAEMSGLPLEELLRSLVDDFARSVEKRYADYLQSKKGSESTGPEHPPDISPAVPPPEQPSAIPAPSSAPEETVESTASSTTPLAPEAVPPQEASASQVPPDVSETAVDTFADLLARVRALGKTETDQTVNAQDEDRLVSKPETSIPSLAELPGDAGRLETDTDTRNGLVELGSELLNEAVVEEDLDTTGLFFEGQKPPRQTCQFNDDDAVYMHAVSLLREDEEPILEPFLLEEKGIGVREFAFAVDHGGLRFYLSKINLTEMNVSKTGILLLGKQESLQMQGVHEGILNDLRAHGTLLPFEFGTVARYKGEFLKKIDHSLDEIKAAVLQLMGTKWWTLSLLVLDAKIAQLVGTVRAQAERTLPSKRKSHSSAIQPRSYDFKVLEKMLQKEKKIAESVHNQLASVTERSDIDMMIGLGSGSTEDWKPILKASYEVLPSRLQHFYRAVTDLQYQYMIFDLMLSLAGGYDFYSFTRKR